LKSLISTLEKYKTLDSHPDEFDSLDSFDTHIDPDSNFHKHLTKDSKYYSDKLFNAKFKSVNGLSLIHVNARSLHHNYKQIEQYLIVLDTTFDVIAISETWQTDTNVVDTFLPNYTSFHTNRKTQRGGGVSIFVKNSLSVTLINNFSFSVDNLFDCITVEIDNKS